ncbi:hypothetical protein MCUN1_002994 [Malassezia cuniculi]|uniref:FIST domain-containing protein n=1 Tax=Malassezia cuniculi TaxID=948313 RepID=A0AAF0ESE3_9BASI|nr:hypothetical protein MCUN1_002994 [Malassezia cuniculi]
MLAARSARLQKSVRSVRQVHSYARTLAASDAHALLPALESALANVSSESVLFYAASRDMPSHVLGEVVQILRQSAARTRIGFLSASLPLGSSVMHSVAFAALDDAIPFRSTISGGARIAVGRWPAQKDLWKMGKSLRTDGLDTGADWRSLWGRENASNELPEALERVEYVDTNSPTSIGTVLAASDSRFQGLIEGLDAHYGSATIAGVVGARTPFSTGREHTLLADGLGADGGIFDNGALGLAIPTAARTETAFDGLQPIGDRLEITAARGNVISALDHANAAQQFLRLVTRTGTNNMTAMQVRELSSEVRKDDEFCVGIFSCKDDTVPVLMARVNSGHPMRGTLSIDTNSELGDTGAWLQLYRKVGASAPPIPSGGPCLVFFSCGAEHMPAANAHGSELVELEHVMYVASDGGWFGRPPARSAPMLQHTHACTVSHARLTIHL